MWVALFSCLLLRNSLVSAIVINLPSQNTDFEKPNNILPIGFLHEKIVPLQDGPNNLADDVLDDVVPMHRILSDTGPRITDDLKLVEPVKEDVPTLILFKGSLESPSESMFDDSHLVKDVEKDNIDENADDEFNFKLEKEDEKLTLDRESFAYLIKESDLLKKLELLEKYRNVFLKYDNKKPIYDKLVGVKLSKIKNNILKFLNWRTEYRIDHIFSQNLSSGEEFYREISYLLKMVKLLDKVEESEGGFTKKNDDFKSLEHKHDPFAEQKESPKSLEIDNNVDQIFVPNPNFARGNTNKIGQDIVIKKENKTESKHSDETHRNPGFYANEPLPQWETKTWALYKHYKFYGSLTNKPIRFMEPSKYFALHNRLVGFKTASDFNQHLFPMNKRGMSILTRLKLFASLINSKNPNRPLIRFIRPEQAMYFLRESNMVSAETRARPAGMPLRWG